MRTLLIKILFWLLKVDLKTKNLIPLTDLKYTQAVESEKEERETIKMLMLDKYYKALSVAYHTPFFAQWLYLQVVTKRNEHIRTLDKEKRRHQVAAMLTLLSLIEEMKTADKILTNNKKPARGKS